MRILYFSRGYTPHDFRFLSSLADSEHEVFHLQLEEDARKVESRPIPAAVKTLHWRRAHSKLSFRNFLAYRQALLEIIHQADPHLVHAGPIQSCAFLTATTGFKPLVSMSWGSDILKESDRNLITKWITKYTLSRTTLLLVDNEAVLKKSLVLGARAKRIVKFPWGIGLETYSPRHESLLRRQLGWQENFVLLSLRSMEPIYGVDVIAQAFSLAVKENPSIRLLLLGGGSQEQKIRDILDQAGVTQYVNCVGHVGQKELPDYYQACDVYVSASHSDGSSVSLMEALASGKPALVSDIPGNREWIDANRNGWFFGDGNVTELKDRIVSIAQNKPVLANFGANAREKAEQKANWQNNFQILLKAYQTAQRLTKG